MRYRASSTPTSCSACASQRPPSSARSTSNPTSSPIRRLLQTVSIISSGPIVLSSKLGYSSRRNCAAILIAVLALAGCGGKTPAQKNTEATRSDNQAVTALHEQTLKAALAEVAVKRADLAHARAVKHLHAVERAIRNGTPPPTGKLPPAEERAFLRADAHFAALERWMRAGARGPCRC